MRLNIPVDYALECAWLNALVSALRNAGLPSGKYAFSVHILLERHTVHELHYYILNGV